ncbi:MAG: sigma-70 family RNA polymerase sigma factor [Candidatus Omnitrophota bacterium]|nr:sigma-70 family RNA polymerase sigma factor [Candidatus Omnitrophota bacterium]
MKTKNSFEEMMMKLSPTLRRITYRLNGHFTFFDEDDLFQEALEHLWVAFEKGTLGDKTDSYILQGCYFHLKNYIRKTVDTVKLYSINSPIDEDGSTIEETLASTTAGSEEAADKALLAESVERSALSEREKTVLSLTLSGMTVREIGEEMGISHVAVVKIRKRLKVKCEEFKK